MQIMIAGAGSYIGQRYQSFLRGAGAAHDIKTVDLMGDGLERADFSGCDSVLHVSGIAHRKEQKEDGPLYMQVNCDLAVATARKAKAAGARQFVFLSTMNVYGRATGEITAGTPPDPVSHYGRSKLAAEGQLRALEDDRFSVAILRPPMVYGPGCRGNFPRLVALATALPCFPATHNRRSMIFIDHLLRAIQLIMEENARGLFFPQDASYVNVSDMVRLIAEGSGKPVAIVPGFSGLMRLIGHLPGAPGKVFGDLYYAQSLSTEPDGYQIHTLGEAINLSLQEGGK